MRFQRRYPVEVEEQVIELHRSGTTWAAIARQTGVSVSWARIWVRRPDRQEGVALPTPPIPRYIATRPFKDLSKWYEARFQQFAVELEETDNPKKVGALKAAVEATWKAFQVTRARHEDSLTRDDDGIAQYRRYLDQQLEKERARIAESH
jgi:hypothetical protein